MSRRAADLALQNYLARAAWLLADLRTFLKTLPGYKADSLCQEIDDYFSEAYTWLNSLPTEISPGTSSTSAPSVEMRGGVWKTPPLSEFVESSSESESFAPTIPPDSPSPAVSSAPLSGGGPSRPSKLLVDFF
jgi:hypothetical protein